MFVDSHYHINFPDLRARLPELLMRMRENRVTHAPCISITLEDSPSAPEITGQESGAYATVGVHLDTKAGVEEGRSTEESALGHLSTLAGHPRMVDIGEAELDYYRLGDRTVADMEWQRDRFRTHIRASEQTGKPLVIHTCSSVDDTLAIMREEGAEAVRGVMHCFAEIWEVTKAALGLNSHISSSGTVTFKNAADLQETAKKVSLDRMLIEANSPYLALMPFHGKMNEPMYVRHIDGFLAMLCGEPLEWTVGVTTDNFFDLFNAMPR